MKQAAIARDSSVNADNLRQVHLINRWFLTCHPMFSASPERALSSSRLFSSRTLRSDNSFAGATNLGIIDSRRERYTLRLSGSVGPNDEADFYKVKIKPDVGIARTQGTWEISGGKIKWRSYKENLPASDGIEPVSYLGFEGSGSNKTVGYDPFDTINNFYFDTVTYYIKIVPTGTKKIEYDFRIVVEP